MRKIVEKINALLKKEKGTIFKEHGGRIKICLVYPDLYHVGTANLGFQTVYRIFNLKKDVVCERAFFPYPDEIEEYEKGFPLISFESKKPLYEFDIIAFSLCFENDYPNILRILQLSGIPFYSYEREFYHPLVVAGGVLCFSNPEPVADIFDLFFIGEAEELIDNFIEVYKTVKTHSYEKDFKDNFKRKILKFEGFYVPEAYSELRDSTGKLAGRQIIWGNAREKIKRVYFRNFFERFSYSQILTSETVFSNMFLIETMRGCPFSCRFCLVGHVYQPVRKASLEILKKKISEAKGFESLLIGIIAPSLTAYSELKELIKIPNIELSFTSLRADKTTLEVLNYLAVRKSLTLAPEAGSERLRRVIKKKITEEDVLLICRKLSETELENLKLYFMIGLPFETDSDIDEIIKLIKKIRNVFHRRLTVSISVFVPKPFTPFQWHGMEDYLLVNERLKKLKRESLRIKGLKLVHEMPKYSYMQGYFARGDRKALKIIERIFKGENFAKIFDEVKSSLYEIRAYEDYLPWEFIEHEGLSKEALWKEYEKAKEVSQTGNI